MTKNIANPELAIRHEPGGSGNDLAASAGANGRHCPMSVPPRGPGKVLLAWAVCAMRAPPANYGRSPRTDAR